MGTIAMCGTFPRVPLETDPCLYIDIYFVFFSMHIWSLMACVLHRSLDSTMYMYIKAAYVGFLCRGVCFYNLQSIRCFVLILVIVENVRASQISIPMYYLQYIDNYAILCI
jgi:hypothetical protein